MITAFLLPALLLSTGAEAADAPSADAGQVRSSPVPAPKPIALVQAWVTAYDMDEEPQADPASYGDPEDDPGLKLRRARLGLAGESEVLMYEVTVGVAPAFDALSDEDDGVELVDAYLGWAPVEDLWLVAGQAKPPISREQLMSSAELALAERSVSSEWLVPGRDAGLTVDWRTRGDARVRVRGGAFNGNGSIFGDDNGGKLLAARAEFAYGPARTYQTWGGEKGFTFGVAADAYHDTDISTQTLSAGGDLMLRVAGFHLMAEGRFAKLSPRNSDIDQPGVFGDVNRWGGLVQAGYGIGPVEPVVRFSMFDDDTSADDNGDVAELTAGITGHMLRDHVRVGGGYVLRLEQGGATLQNDTVRLWTSLRY